MKETKAFITMICLLCLTAAMLALYLIGAPQPETPQGGEPAGQPQQAVADPSALPPEKLLPLDARFSAGAGTGLTVFSESMDGTAPIGSYHQFKVLYRGKSMTYQDVTFELVAGYDCAAMYYTGETLGLGEGLATVRAFLDADPSVYGYGSVRVVKPDGDNKYTELREDVSDAPSGDAAFEAAIAAFPESYRPHLRALHQRYPEWEFRPMKVGVDFFEAVYQESIYDKNLTLLANMADLIKSKAPDDYDRATHAYVLKDTGWVAVNPLPVAWFMDPRNFLDERSAFQFETLSFDAGVHTVQGVEGILRGSFMADADTSYYNAQGERVESSVTYAQAIFAAAKQTGVNPYFLAAKIRQEIGSSPSRAATGLCPGYEGYYNFYNIGATDGPGNVERGLEWASTGDSYGRPWTSPQKSILGGAQYLVQGYVAAGQHTGYLQKFNVNPDSGYSMYAHQYMTNVSGAQSQALSAYSGYADIGMLNSRIVFSIPVYDNMPNNAAQEISLGGSAAGLVTRGVVLREGPAAFHDAVFAGTVPRRSRVTILRCVRTDARYFQNRLFFPCWYEVSYTAPDGETYRGYLSEEFVERAPSRAVAAGETLPLTVETVPENCGDVVRFYSDNRAVATVDSDGVVTAVGPGSVTVIGYTAGGAVDCIRLTVTDAP